MVRGRQGSGVEPLKNSIRVRFTWMGVRETVTLDLKPTPPNIRATEKLMQRVRMAIENQTFRHEDFFPHLAALKPPEVIHLWKDVAELWFKGLTVEYSTKRFYRTGLRFWATHLDDLALRDVKHSQLRAHLAEAAEDLGPQSINLYLLVARAVFALAKADEIVSKDPTDGLANHTIKLKHPDPFTREERDRIIAWLHERDNPQAANYYEFSFLTGMRPEEVIALRWTKLDEPGRRILVDCARVSGRDKGTKSGKDRYVDLTERAEAVLKRQKAFTFMKDPEGHIFENPSTGRPWTDCAMQRKRHWAPCLRALKLRHRFAYQTRHTFATLALVDNVNIAYLAKQLGHANAIVTLRHYAHWVSGEDNGRERAKLEGSHGQFRGQFGQPQAAEGSIQ